jgi:protein associated with RNAse G/E
VRNPVRVFKRKYDGTLRREFTGDLVEATADGWLVVFHDAERHESFKDGQPAYTSPYILYALSERRPLALALYFDERGGPMGVHGDAALPASIRGREITFVDLDLDVVVEGDGPAALRDEAAFAANRERMGYPPEVVVAAWEGIRIIREVIAEARYPLDGSAERLLGSALAARGPL